MLHRMFNPVEKPKRSTKPDNSIGALVARQTLVESIDMIAAKEPDRAWVSIPKDDNDLSKGFIDVTYAQLIQAVDAAAHWMQSVLGSRKFESFAYAGPGDVRWAILAAAAAKSEKVMLLMYPLMPAQAKEHLLKATQTSVILHAESSRDAVEALIVGKPDMKSIAVLPLSAWMTAMNVTPFPFLRNWDDVKSDPWLIFHTSGTTGLPKPVVYSQLMMTSIAQSERFPDANTETSLSLLYGARVHQSIPMNHFVGMIAVLPSSVYLGSVLVMGPPSRPPSLALSSEVLKYGNVTGFIGPPSMIQGLCANPEPLELLRKLKFVKWAGAPLDKASGDLLCSHVRLSPAMGTTECGIYFTRPTTDPADWRYYSFRDGQDMLFEARSSLYLELIFRKSKSARWQQIFLLHPELNLYFTGDMFIAHPSKPGLWLYVGRKDDLIKLSNGEFVQTADLERIFMQNPAVTAALVGGAGAPRPHVLLEMVGSVVSRGHALDLLQKEMEAVDSLCAEDAMIYPELILVADSERPFKRSAKQSVLRKETFDLYQYDIEAAYSRWGDRWRGEC